MQLAIVLWNRCKDQNALSYTDQAKELSPAVSLLMYARGIILHTWYRGNDGNAMGRIDLLELCHDDVTQYHNGSAGRISVQKSVTVGQFLFGVG